MRKRLVIVNEKLGKSSAFDAILEEMGRDDLTQILRLNREVKLNESVRKAVVDDKCRLVVAAGGDGTVNVVVNAIMCLPSELRPQLTIIPIGTANDFAGTLQISDDIQEVVDSMYEGEFVPIDMVRIRAGQFVRFFANVAAGGNSVEVSESITDDIKATWGPLCYLRGAVGVLGAMKTYQIRATLDEEVLEVESWGGPGCERSHQCRTHPRCATCIPHRRIACCNNNQEWRYARHDRNCFEDTVLQFTGKSADSLSTSEETGIAIYAGNAFYSRRGGHR